jgi:type IV secretion system protein VirB10
MPAGYGGIPGFGGADDGTNQFRMPANSAYGRKELPDVSNAQPLVHPDHLMLRGTYIRCVLETHIVTDIPGFTSCIVTEPVYSFNGKHLLLPKGSKVLGKYDQEPNGPRVAVIWDRIVTPSGIDVSMASPGIDNLGGAGHPGHYAAHWASRVSAALLISLLSDAFKYEAAEHGPKSNQVSANGTVVQQPFESNTALTIQNLANQAVRRAANRPATVTINQGTVVTIYVAKDVDFTGVLARY